MNRIAFLVALLSSGAAFAQAGGATITVAKMQRLKYGPASAGTTASQTAAMCADTGACAVLNAVAANSSASARTFTLYTRGFSRLKVQLVFTWSSATTEVLTCSESLDMGNHFGNMASVSINNGVGTDYTYTDNRTVSANDDITLNFDVANDDFVQCVWSATAGGANDTVSVFATSAVGL